MRQRSWAIFAMASPGRRNMPSAEAGAVQLCAPTRCKTVHAQREASTVTTVAALRVTFTEMLRDVP